MGERTEYTPGTFCWTDLTTTDQEAAKAFYGGLFGWEAEDMPVGDGVYYSMQRVDGKDVAAISPQQQQLGATVHAPPFDVMEAGRMAVIQDPQGAHFLLWQANRHIGAALVNAPGAPSWNELASPDLDASKEFYSSLFGWTVEPFEGSPQPYLTIKNGEANNGGIRELDSPGPPPHWLVYFAIDDIDQGLAKVEQLGGVKHAGPMDIGIAKIAVVADPQGAIFALYAGQLEP
jgi:predicted enzyme related to lactoylglutathione lyase